MTILHLILNLAALVLLTFFLIDLVKGIANPETTKTSWFAVGALTVLISASIIIVNFIPEPPATAPYESQIQEHDENHDYLWKMSVYRQMLDEDSMNLDAHFNYVNCINEYADERNRGRKFNPSEMFNWKISRLLKARYDDYIASGDQDKRDIGFMFQSFWYSSLEQPNLAENRLDSVQNKSIKYYEYILGKTIADKKRGNRFEDAESHLKAATLNKDTRLAYGELAKLYYYFQKDKQLHELWQNPEAKPFMADYLKRVSAMRSYDYLSYWVIVVKAKISKIDPWGFVSAVFILMLWLFFIRRLDIYEPEKWKHVLATLFMSMATLFLVYPLQDILYDVFHYFRSSDPVDGLIHMTISIGMIEELVKLIPVLIMLRFTKAINEPYDYILYCSIAGLGFGFVENLGYLQHADYMSISARGIYAGVMHMVFSATIGYGLMLIKYKKLNRPWIYAGVFFIIASLGHALYDFWLIHETTAGWAWVSTIFLILGIHIWFIYANNTLNITTFYDPKIEIKNEQLRYYLVIGLSGMLLLSYVLNASIYGPERANEDLWRLLFQYTFFVLYLSFSFSRFDIVRGYLAPFSFNYKLLIPRLKRDTNFSGAPLTVVAGRLKFVTKHEHLHSQLPLSGTLLKKLVVNDDLESYILKLDAPLEVEDALTDRVVISPKTVGRTLNHKGRTIVKISLIPSEDVLNQPLIADEDLEMIGWGKSKRTAPKSI